MTPPRSFALPLLLAAAAASLVARAQAQLPPLPVPPQNPLTPAKVQLGKALFWDEQLSSTRTVACGTCHIPGAGGGDPRAAANPGADGVFGTGDDVVGSPGVPASDAGGAYVSVPDYGIDVQATGRQAPSMINAAYAPELFWDGRATSAFVDPLTGATVIPAGGALESQAMGPPASDVEMGHAGRDWADVLARIEASAPLALAPSVPAALEGWIAGRSYPELFEETFGTDDVTAARVGMAIASYERTLIADQTRFDQFIAGDPGALTPAEQRGFDVFTGPGRCATCHAGALFSDQQFHYIGVRPQADDLGRFAVTGAPPDRGAFKTPGLRNVALSAPYFHDGSAANLGQVVDFYARGGDFNAPNLGIAPFPLPPPARADLLAFLSALTDERVRTESAPFDRPLLYAESSRVPQQFGVATQGTGGFVPEAVTLEPPLVGNPSMTLGIQGALGDARAVLVIDPVGVPGGTPFQGTTLYLGLSAGLMRKPVGRLNGSGPGAGWGSAVVALPDDPALVGSTLYAQWYVFDQGAPGHRFATSRGIEIVPF